jgi:hypothetical protein
VRDERADCVLRVIEQGVPLLADGVWKPDNLVADVDEVGFGYAPKHAQVLERYRLAFFEPFERGLEAGAAVNR